MKRKNILIKAGVSLIITLMILSSTAITANIMNEKTPISEVIKNSMLSFNQVNYVFEDGEECTDTYIGQVLVDTENLTAHYGLSSGFLQVMTPMGWVIQNFYISSEVMNEGIPHIESKFMLRDEPVSNVNVETIEAWIDFDSVPTSDPAGGEFITYPVSDAYCYLEGNYSEPLKYEGISFTGVLTNICEQANHPNVQAACNQCAPAAVANSLQYLENQYPGLISIPHDNIPGYGNSNDGKAYPPNSLVAHLDLAMGRIASSRKSGLGVWPKEGKLRYIHDTGLGNVIKVKYQGDIDPGKDTVGDVTAEDKGDVSFDFIFEEICAGEDVEIVLHYPNCGRHMVELTAAGYILGIPFIKHISDLQQTCQNDPTDIYGCDTEYTDFLNDNGAGLVTVIGGSDQAGTVVEMVYTQSPKCCFEIKLPKGLRFGIKAIIKENCNENHTNVPWKFEITGGFIIPIAPLNGTVDCSAGEIITIRSLLIFGFGRIQIKVTIDNCPSVSADAIIIGPFVIVR